MTANDWVQTLPGAALTIALLFLPGIAVARALGGRGLPALAAAPAISGGTYAVLATLLSWTPVRWGTWTAVGCALLLLAAAAVIARVRGERVGMQWSRPVGRADLVSVLTALLVGAFVIGAAAVPAIGRPGELVDSPDAVFHLNLVTTFLATGKASMFDPVYPDALHTAAAAIAPAFGEDVFVSVNVLVLVLACIVWPLGCVALTRSVLGRDALSTIGAGVAAGALVSYPTILMGWGILWPNVMGTACLPGVCALALQQWRRWREGLVSRPRTEWLRALRTRDGLEPLLLGGVTVVALGTEHPNAVVSLGVFALCWGISRGFWRAATGRASWTSALLWTAAVITSVSVVLLLLPRLSSRLATTAGYTWAERTSLAQAISDGLTGSYQLEYPQVAITLWLFAGIAWVCVRRPQSLGVASSWLATIALFVLCSWSTASWSPLITGYWYNDKVRLAALACVPGVVLVVAGLRAAQDLVLSRSERTPQLTALASLAAVATLVLTTLGLSHNERTTLLSRYYHPQHQSQEILSEGDRAALERIGASLPVNAVVAARPESGAALLWTVAHRHALFERIPPEADADGLLIGTHLSEVAVRPDVCAALARKRVTHVLDSSHTYWLDRPEITASLGNIAGLPGFRKVTSDGRFTLYTVTACGTSG